MFCVKQMVITVEDGGLVWLITLTTLAGLVRTDNGKKQTYVVVEPELSLLLSWSDLLLCQVDVSVYI